MVFLQVTLQAQLTFCCIYIHILADVLEFVVLNCLISQNASNFDFPMVFRYQRTLGMAGIQNKMASSMAEADFIYFIWS
jgi:hypothetical protein